MSNTANINERALIVLHVYPIYLYCTFIPERFLHPRSGYRQIQSRWQGFGVHRCAHPLCNPTALRQLRRQWNVTVFTYDETDTTRARSVEKKTCIMMYPNFSNIGNSAHETWIMWVGDLCPSEILQVATSEDVNGDFTGGTISFTLSYRTWVPCICHTTWRFCFSYLQDLQAFFCFQKLSDTAFDWFQFRF